jgi:hypothetical protein
MKNMKKAVRKLAPLIPLLLHLIAAVSFIVYCWMEYRAIKADLTAIASSAVDPVVLLNEMIRAAVQNIRILALVASIEFVAVVVDLLVRRYEAAETKALRDKFEENEKKTSDLWRQSGPWRISDWSEAAIKESLSAPDYAGQEFVVYREYENTDGEQFAKDLAKILIDCGWFGTVEIPNEPIPYTFPYGVCVWTTESITHGDTVKMQAIGQAMGRAGIHMADRQKWKAVTRKTIPTPNMVLFCIGKKPPL